MAGEVKPIRTKRDYEAALKEVERLWGAKSERATATVSMCSQHSSMPMRPSTIRWTHRTPSAAPTRRSSDNV
jgi:antitoxin component HigA of HigAB toxin-antitoxin module